MATVDERSLGVARLYAKAMLDIAAEQGAVDDLGDELDGMLDEMRRSPEFATFLASPIIERASRSASIEATMRGRASDLLVDSLQVINKKDRLAILPQIIEVYHEQQRERRGEIEVRLSTAVELNDAQREYVRERVKVTTGKDAFLVETVDTDLLGGLVVQVGDQKIDMSVRRDLELLSHRFEDRLEVELHREGAFSSDADSGDEASASEDGRNSE